MVITVRYSASWNSFGVSGDSLSSRSILHSFSTKCSNPEIVNTEETTMKMMVKSCLWTSESVCCTTLYSRIILRLLRILASLKNDRFR